MNARKEATDKRIMDIATICKKTKNKPLKLAFVNQKGGVGKSTSAINVSACLAELGYSTLLVDLDPQGNSTSGFGVDKTSCEFTTYDCLLNDDVDMNEVILPLQQENAYIIPATIDLAGAEPELVNAIARETRLTEALEKIEQYFDFIIIDCPPSLSLLTINALVATDQLIIPIQAEYYSLEGLSKILDSMNLVKKRLNSHLDVFGVLLTMFDSRTTLAKQVAAEAENYFGNKVFETRIPRTVRLSEAPGYGEPIITYDPRGKGACAYRSLTQEIVARSEELLH